IGEVFLWNRSFPNPAVSLKVADKFIHCATLSPDGRRLLVGDEAGKLTVWEIAKAGQTQVAKNENPSGE
ncbi:MAG: hypothetical protein KDA84_17515, partial [Planctomycetaceae bacterium]|nr:hypothetical protein [Planctomycetaceae bacterium]